MGRRKRGREPFVRLDRHELECAAYRSLSPEGRSLLIEMRALYAGRENRVYMSLREIQKRLGVGRDRAEKARNEILDRGFLRLLEKASFSRKARHAPVYALTNEPLEPHRDGATPPKDYMRWQPQKSTVRVTSTDGAGDQHRQHATAKQKGPLGAGDQHRDPQSGQSLGAGDQHTDRLPPEGELKDAPAWLLEHGGWPVMLRPDLGEPREVAFVLNTCCIVCGVWTTSGGYEYDGSKHSCNKVDKAKYRKRLATDEQAAA